MRLLLFISLMIAIAASDDECGKQQSGQPLVFGGSAVSTGEFPWLVPLMRKFGDKFFCASNLISHQHLLTAAHCVTEKGSSNHLTVNDFYAYLGRFNLLKSAYEKSSVKADLKQIIVHPNWSANDVRYDADIAILVLKKPVEFSEIVQPVCLPSIDQQVFKVRGTVVGYGKSESGALHENIPRKVQISSYTNDDCFFTDFQFARFASPRTFCAGERGKTPCRGDSGGGFLIDVRSSWTIMGLVSSSTIQECGQNDFVLFTNVVQFISWIRDEMDKANKNTPVESPLNEIEEDPNDDRINFVDTKCDYKEGSYYACHLNKVQVPDEDSQLRIIGGNHSLRRTNRDVSFLQMVSGDVPYFPDLTSVLETFPNLGGLGIAYAKMKFIDRTRLKDITQFKFLLISDNQIEEIPPDTFLDMQNLELIDICRNKIKNLEPTWIAKMPKLRYFKARSNRFQYVPADMFKNNPQLEEILFDYNQLQRIDVNFAQMTNLKSLKILDNACIDKAFCTVENDEKCIKNLKQFALLVQGFCGDHSN